ncbi:YeeE/YedE family protein [uncultured Shewanella sp.]|uniref:YeeE/YedE family protein n=1 Tax=uncultured Shewanella sp. TaxID=173975 RepID=UPI0026326EC9|nr:YeeE/YedE family protein [uncultured Shewanella sp.]
MIILIALLCGILFGLGLIISQMVDPNKVLHFLDVTGNWDPSLAFVMFSALVVFVPIYHLIIKHKTKPKFTQAFHLPKKVTIDLPLILGASVFGIGWGISGICPGPALVNITGGSPKILVFIVMMLIGMHIPKYAKMLLSKFRYTYK